MRCHLQGKKIKDLLGSSDREAALTWYETSKGVKGVRTAAHRLFEADSCVLRGLAKGIGHRPPGL